MPRPRLQPSEKRSRIVGTKITQAEGEVWDAAREKLGGPVRTLGESDALRYAMVLLCRSVGLEWPDEGTPRPPPAASAPEPKKKRAP